MKDTPKSAAMNSIPGLRFCALVGTEDVRLEADYVVGRWKKQPVELYPGKSPHLAEEFANWPDDAQSVLRFTKKYGPVTEQWKSGGAEFRFPLFEWRGQQEHFRSNWESIIRRRGIDKGAALDTNTRHTLVLKDRWPVYQTHSLTVFLSLDLYSCGSESVRICKRPDCPNRYFISRHLGRQYCSEVCAQWRQKFWKREWWAKHGKKWLAGRRKPKREKGKKKKSRKGR